LKFRPAWGLAPEGPKADIAVCCSCPGTFPSRVAQSGRLHGVPCRRSPLSCVVVVVVDVPCGPVPGRVVSCRDGSYGSNQALCLKPLESPRYGLGKRSTWLDRVYAGLMAVSQDWSWSIGQRGDALPKYPTHDTSSRAARPNRKQTEPSR
jgi:hypothetical protein